MARAIPNSEWLQNQHRARARAVGRTYEEVREAKAKGGAYIVRRATRTSRVIVAEKHPVYPRFFFVVEDDDRCELPTCEGGLLPTQSPIAVITIAIAVITMFQSHVVLVLINLFAADPFSEAVFTYVPMSAPPPCSLVLGKVNGSDGVDTALD